ncbi:RICIN domain-containing protein [Actinomadura syzygii]|uniref:RICIN domain-containing protein n=1 Tax=Actinomadura syzygii TaxID=1427538 RepID=A0A5D0UKW3_9ACTN|nr:RICIN domain-containing protein [Actinomadura syzygii]TYC18252.1 RICIN domain-containing protein [Actinomadura syzygii]
MRREVRFLAPAALLTALLASALATALTGAPANAAVGTARVSRASGTASPADVPLTGRRWGNVNSGLCLAYDVESRGAARQESCFNGAGADYTIFWEDVNVGGDNYEIKNKHNGQCLSIAGGSSNDGAAAFVFTCNGTADQLFKLVPVPQPIPGLVYFEIVNVNSGKCVSVGGGRTNLGAWVIQWTCAGTGAQLWRAA